MSFSFRDKPRLSERLRGKSGDDLINELKNHIDQERKMFFDTAPNWGSVHPSGSFSSRTGFPFDDDMMPRSGRQDIRAHLDDLAQRHPEFAEQLRCPPWAGEMSGSPSHTGTWRRGSNEGEPHTQARSSSSSSNVECDTGTSSPKPEDSRGRNPFPQQGEPGRDDGGNRGQRSMSAPPDARNQQSPQPQNQPQQTPQPQRYVSRVNITPGKPPVAPQKPQSPQQSSSNVRHIPIFVEGRDEPILPKNVVSEDPPPEQVFSQRIPPQPQQTFSKPQTYTSHHQFQPQQRFYSPPQSTRTEYARPHQNVPQSKPETVFSQQNAAPSMQQPATQQPKATPKQQQQQQQQQPPPPKPQQPNDPIHRVQAVQKDVENLQRMVENFTGTSRKDKQYIYLDEMLTRNLLKLDDIDTEGKENVRQARKEAIRSIQKCISILESKVPAPEEQNESAVLEEAEGMQPVESGDTVQQREENPAEQMEAESVPPAVVENAGEKIEADVRGANEQIEKMDVEHSVPTQQPEAESSVVETKEESQPSTETETSKSDNTEDKGETADTQLTMEVVVSPEASVAGEATNQAGSEKPSEKGDKSDMEVEPPASVQTDVNMEEAALPQKDETAKADVEPQKEEVKEQPPLQTVNETDLTKVTEVPESVGDKSVDSTETEPKTQGDTTTMQVEPIPTTSEITNPPKTEETSETQKESVQENVSSEQPSDKDSKQEVDTKKKKTGKKVKSPSQETPKQGSSNKPDSVSSSEEAQKS